MSTDDAEARVDYGKHHHTHHHIRTYDLPQFFGIVEKQIYRYTIQVPTLIQVGDSSTRSLPISADVGTYNDPSPIA